MSIETIIWAFLLIDAIGANLMSWLGAKWYTKHFAFISRYFPPAKGWCLYYLILILWIGWILFRG